MSETEKVTTQTNPYLIPGAIVLAGLIIAGAIVMKGGSSPEVIAAAGVTQETVLLPITEDDHILGPKDADLFLVEYSDYRCGFCGVFHDTIKHILGKYEGRVAWVYRHTPYQPGGREATIASECVAELAGEDAFWEFTDAALADQRALSNDWYLTMAAELGIDEETFSECLTSGRYDTLIEKQTLNSQELGGRGTPFTVLLTKEGRVTNFSGALPPERVEAFVESALESLDS
jgi:protein-disulfide isomerase